MSVSVDKVREDFAGDDATTVFPTTLLVVSAEDVRVWDIDETVDPATVTELVSGVGFTATLTDPAALPSALSINVSATYASGLPSDHTLAVVRQRTFTQDVAFTDGDRFPGSAVELVLDEVVLHAQEARWLSERSLRAPPGDLDADVSLELPIQSERAGKFLLFDSAGEPTVQAGSIDPTLVPVSSPFGEDLVGAADAAAGRAVLDFDAQVAAAITAALTTFQNRKRNILINPQFGVVTRYLASSTTPPSFSAAADGDPGWDGWRFYADGIIADLATLYAISGGATTLSDQSAALQVSSPSSADTKVGLGAMVMAEDAARIIAAGKASFRFQVRRSSGTDLTRFRAALVAWTDALNRDEMTVDPISAWGAQGANPTLATNFSYLSTPSAHFDISADPTTFQTFSVEDIDVPSVAMGGPQNLLLLIWADVGDAGSYDTADVWEITDVALVASDSIDGVEPRSLDEDAALCARHYRSFGDARRRLRERHYASAASEVHRFTYPISPELFSPNDALVVDTEGTWTTGATNVTGVSFAATAGGLNVAVTATAAGIFEFDSGSTGAGYHVRSDAWV